MVGEVFGSTICNSALHSRTIHYQYESEFEMTGVGERCKTVQHLKARISLEAMTLRTNALIMRVLQWSESTVH